MQTIELRKIRIDGGTQSRACINEQAVADYAEAMQGGAEFPPIVAFFDGAAYWLADGFHRYQASKRAGLDSIAADVRQGTQRDAILYSVGANASHGLRRTNDDKRRAALTLLNDAEWSKWSNNEIAKRCGVSHSLINGIRSSLETASSEPRTYTTKHGTPATMKTANIGGAQRTERTVAELSAEPASRPDLRIVETVPPEEPEATDPVEAKLRREFRAMTALGQEDAYVTLMMDLRGCQTNARQQAEEIRTLKALNDELSASDSTTVIRALQAKLKNAENAKWREGEKTAAALRQVHALKKQLKAMGAEEIAL